MSALLGWSKSAEVCSTELQHEIRLFPPDAARSHTTLALSIEHQSCAYDPGGYELLHRRELCSLRIEAS